jgi:VIT1/CCC1 family predicted Fe2+/Mn2+ transporter
MVTSSSSSRLSVCIQLHRALSSDGPRCSVSSLCFSSSSSSSSLTGLSASAACSLSRSRPQRSQRTQRTLTGKAAAEGGAVRAYVVVHSSSSSSSSSSSTTVSSIVYIVHTAFILCSGPVCLLLNAAAACMSVQRCSL